MAGQKSRETVGDHRPILGRNSRHVSDSISGLIMGDFEHGTRDDPFSIHKGGDRTECHERECDWEGSMGRDG